MAGLRVNSGPYTARNHVVNVTLGALLSAGLLSLCCVNYLLFHVVAEIFIIVIAFSIFIITWNLKSVIDEKYFLLIGIAYFFVGVFEVVHTMAYQGMNVLPWLDANPATQLWIVARFLEAGSLLLAGFMIGRSLNYYLVFSSYGAVAALLGLAIAFGYFPACFVEGVGLTFFKKLTECVIVLVFLGAGGMLWRRREDLDPYLMRWLLGAIVVSMLGELAFCFHGSLYDVVNVIGHFLALISFYMIYRAVIQTALVDPHRTLFRNLKATEEALRKVNEAMERRIRESTEELREANAKLWEEISHSRQSQVETVQRYMHMARKAKMDAVARLTRTVASHFESVMKDVAERGEAILRDMDGGHPLRRHAEEIVKAGETTFSFARNLEAVGQAQDMSRKELELNGLISAMAEELSQISGDGVRVRIMAAEDLWKVKADPGQVERAILAIVRNARESMPSGGELTIETSNIVVDEKSGHEHPGLAPGSYVMMDISDTGMGMNEDVQSRLFEPFFTTKGHDGRGMGLAMAYGIIIQSGGHIHVISELGDGSVFSIYLPKA